jgi:site-specific recombinase XerD
MSVTALVPLATHMLPVCAQPADRVQEYLNHARARNTIRGYRSSFRQFEAWCQASFLCALPAASETIARYLSEQAGRLKCGTLEHHLAAISKAHKTAGLPSPIRENVLIGETLKGIKRVHGTAQTQKAPILTEDLRLMLRVTPKTLLGVRDRALLLVGFTGAFRRSELVALSVDDLHFSAEGVLITLRRSKTDQEGLGRRVALPFGTHAETCPVRALQNWIAAATLSDGPVFRVMRRYGRVLADRLSDHAVALVVKRYAELAGLQTDLYSGHSLRAGFVTSAARAGEPERRIMRQTGHKSFEMVMRYVRNANAFQDNSALALGL